MQVRSLYTFNFRNYPGLELKLDSMINVFYGRNAQGKTNLLEAIFYSAYGCSHRTSQEEELVNLNYSEMAVGIKFSCLSGSHEIKIKKYSQLGKWKKEILLDLAKIRPKEHYGYLSVVMFSPEDLQLIKGEPALRRRFLDMQIAQTDRVYYELLVKYNRVLQQRNKLLKDLRDSNGDPIILNVWNLEFANLAAAITQKRLAALVKLAGIVTKNYSELTAGSENLQLLYELKSNNGELLYPEFRACFTSEFFLTKLKERQRVDILRGNTGIGPHRDDLYFKLNGLSLKAYGSQGQHRSSALALKLSQLEYVYQELGEYPVLLLDDVMSELDNYRRGQLLQFINGKVQTFITVNDKELIPSLEGTAFYEISQGILREDKNAC